MDYQHASNTCLLLMLLLIAIHCYNEPGLGQAALEQWQLPKPVVQFYSSNRTLLGTLGRDLVLSRGDTINASCMSDFPLEWVVLQGKGLRTQSSFKDTNLQKIEINNTENVNGYRYVSNLYAVDVPFYYTGNYVCMLQNDPQHNTSVYVYVSDPEQPFLDREYINISFYPNHLNLYHGNREVIPCHTTHPDIPVVLKCECHPPKILGKNESVEFDPKQGIIIDRVDSQHDGVYTCEALLNNKTYRRTYTFKINMGQDVPPMPYLNFTRNSGIHRLVGESFSVACLVKIDKQHSRPTMNWSYLWHNKTQPEVALTRQHSHHISITKSYGDGFQDSALDEWRTDIEVHDVSKNDEGIYKCTVTLAEERSGSAEICVYVHEQPFVRLILHSKSITVRENVNDKADFFINITAYPTPEFYWTKGNLNITKQNTNIDSDLLNDDQFFLRIKYPKRTDAGIYTVTAWVKDMETSLDVELIVEYVPTGNISTQNADQFFLVEMEHTISCHIQSVPYPHVMMWFWQSCESPYTCELNDGHWEPVIQTDRAPVVFPKIKNTFASDQQINISHLIIKQSTITTGFYKCRGENSLGKIEKKILFVGTDVKNGFDYCVTVKDPMIGDSWVAMKDPVFGDSVTMSFKASLWKYSNLTVVNQTLDNLAEPVWDMNRTTIKYFVENNNSVVTYVIISPITIYDTHNFTCLGYTLNGTNIGVVKTLQLNIKDIIPPKFQLDFSQIIKINKNSYAFNCDVNGLPTPTVEWYKDFGKINSNNMSEGMEISNNNQRLIINATNPSFSGMYTCVAENRGGRASLNFSFEYEKTGDKVALASWAVNMIIAFGVLILALVVVTLIVYYVVKRRSLELHKDLEQYLIQQKGDYNPEMPLDEQTSCIPYDAKWEFPKERLRLGMILGQGAFGRVVKAEAVGIVEYVDVLSVAVKMVKDCTDRDQMMTLLSELKILIHIGQHLNILNLLGACTKQIAKGELYVIVEYCHFGNLRTYILKHKDAYQDVMNEDYLDPLSEKMREAKEKPEDTDQKPSKPFYVNNAAPENTEASDGPPLTKKNMISWVYQVARGMEYLASRKYIHRDLAARNVLLTDDNVVKICDFGLSKDCYKYDNEEYKKKGDGPVPVKWMAIESLTHRLYTTKSDVWSFGVFLWEVFSLGGNPYPGIDLNDKFIGLLKDGYRMERPDHCTDEMYQVMMNCWKVDPDERPTFTGLVSTMGDFLEDNVKQYYLDLGNDVTGADEQEQAATGTDTGYLSMNSVALKEPNDYTKMSPAPPTPADFEGMDKGKLVINLSENKYADTMEARYLNFNLTKKNTNKDRKKNKQHFEVQPLIHNINERKIRDSPDQRRNNIPGSPVQFNTQAEIHDNNNSDSGHENFVPGNSPDKTNENDGYLSSKNIDSQDVPQCDMNGFVGRKGTYPKSVENGLARLLQNGATSKYNYQNLLPPSYLAVMEATNETNV